MAFYFSVNIRIDDPEGYQKYLDRVDDIFAMHGGEYLAVDKSPEVLEGKWEYTKAVLIRFSSKEEFEKWYYSESYQEILKYRLSSSLSDAILVEGIE
jgi:uncharacterized protein (DUF1330 family)